MIEQLLSAGKDIVVPNVVMERGGRSYDLNSWRAASSAATGDAPGDAASVGAVTAFHDAVHKREVAAGRPLALHLQGYGGERGAQLYLHQLRCGGDAANSSTASGSPPLRLRAPPAPSAAAQLAKPLPAAPPPPPPPPCVVRLDGVGGAVLLVRAELHRHGLVFPPYPHRHRIETEGLAMLALDMGTLSYGMPYVEIVHK